ncbi:RbsD/FucU family protein [Cohaesibacter gelatinilyticus]|uniref:L-fucose mutarotase n=1 Tax=Cohaesibacter gelatinilyticus TaxID=372072 RepID=A0A285PEW5_9HYPH|nr:RbsD/FucU domain-containing protein [Cohaesibacter gelatinilyticus]SNZ20262.1 L-fucose mutarotase [Cohaesibacter gelatinilyticus]
MLRDIDPILSPDLLHILRAMGHGDELVIADANFPATSTGQRITRLDGLEATQVLQAVLSVMPLDNFVSDPALTMQMVEDPSATPPIVLMFQDIINDVADHPAQIQSLERFAFYQRAKSAFAVVQTGEQRLYGNIIVKKGVVAP